MTWDHGYFVGATYTCNFFRELAPAWLDFAALMKGHSSPRPNEGAPFAYLELGSGMGLGLCLLAAAYPEGRFTGIDFMPEHISHARQLATALELTNVQFLEADLIHLARDLSPLHDHGILPGSCHYVVAHGLLSWVSEAVQSALLEVATAALLPEGFFYGSYNTYPGWLAMTSFQHLATLELARSDSALPERALQQAATTLTSLLGTEERRLPLAQACPLLTTDLEQIPHHAPAYLIQEYANRHWRPLYVAELHERSRLHKLRYISTASLPDLFEGLLPEPARSVVLGEANPTHRQTLLDLATNRSFRRDLFSRGSLPLRDAPLQARMEALTLRLQEAPPQEAYIFRADYGQVSGKPEFYGAIEAALADGPLSIGELADRIEKTLQEVVQAVALLLHNNRLGLDRGDAGSAATATAERVNAQLLTLIQEGAPYAQLVAPAIGSGIGITPLESLLLEALRQGLEGNVLAACVQMGLQALHVELRELDGKPLASEAARRKAILKAAAAFAEKRLPFLQALGVVPAASTSAPPT